MTYDNLYIVIYIVDKVKPSSANMTHCSWLCYVHGLVIFAPLVIAVLSHLSSPPRQLLTLRCL